ncbi:MAG: hypothetical protein U5Q44_06615 [Dehalococcoidia bacterium]|nr:hypothetical protein [Dehalococcoidia bacterium]
MRIRRLGGRVTWCVRPSASASEQVTLATQLEEMGSVPAALAAYNAGPTRARGWLEVAPGDVPADYVEAVSISETRSYIEKVMSAWAYYERAWRDE